jgi:hypothetical protein
MGIHLHTQEYTWRRHWSCVGVYRLGRLEIITNEHGGRTTPSYVAFTDTERLVGDPAKNQAARNSTNTIFGECIYPLFRFGHFLDFSNGVIHLHP